MGQTLNVTMKRFNGTDNDNLLVTPAQHASTHEAEGTDPISVSTTMIDDNAITNEKMANDSVDTAEIKNKAVTANKCADGVLARSYNMETTTSVNGFTIFISTGSPSNANGNNGDIWIKYTN